MARVRPQTAAKPPRKRSRKRSRTPVEADAELVSLEEADDEAAESGAVKVHGADEEVARRRRRRPSSDEEEDDDDDVGDIIGDVDEEER